MGESLLERTPLRFGRTLCRRWGGTRSACQDGPARCLARAARAAHPALPRHSTGPQHRDPLTTKSRETADSGIFYDIEGASVLVLGIVLKSDAERWLRNA